jgi:hypothetical protein
MPRKTADTATALVQVGAYPDYYCLSCGATENIGRRRYCSKECRLDLLWRLRILATLLRALRTREATFSFTQTSLVVDIRTCDSRKAYRFVYERKKKRKPAVDLFEMTDELGGLWWQRQRLTGKRYRASQYLLENATKKDLVAEEVMPHRIKHPLRIGKSLTCLRLNTIDLYARNAREAVKSAYRREALKHHPDRGGSSSSFRRVSDAYREVLKWLENPELRVHLGVPDKWYFDGDRWRSPLQVRWRRAG